MNEIFKDEKGNSWITDDALVFGSYAGNGVVAKANIDYLINNIENVYHCNNMKGIKKDSKISSNEVFKTDEEYDNCELLIFHDIYNTIHAFVKICDETSDVVEEIESLENYPCFDDELVTRIENQWINEAKENYVDELIRSLAYQYPNLDTWLHAYQEKINGEPIDVFYHIFENDMFYAINETSSEWIFEYDSAYIDINNFADCWKEMIFNDIRYFYSKNNK